MLHGVILGNDAICLKCKNSSTLKKCRGRSPALLLSKNTLIDNAVSIIEDVEHYFFYARMCVQIFLYRLNGNFSSSFFREHKHSRRYAAESNTVYTIRFSKLKARTITGCQQITMSLSQSSIHNWPDSMKNIFARKIIGRCDFRLTCWFFMPLPLNDIIALQA